MEETLAKYFSGECTKDEIDQIVSWRNESEDNAKAFFEAKNIWLALGEKPEPNMTVLEGILGEPQQKEVRVSFGWIKYAAAAMIVFAIGFVIISNLVGDGLNVEKLADGSEITLHDEASIQSVRITEEIREVTLTGKAYFDIERDEERPFIVVTDNARIEVLGTTFMIDATNSSTEVCVESGIVALTKPGKPGKTDLTVKLEKGEMGTVENIKEGIVKKNNTNANYLSWKTKTLIFEQSKMSDVESTLEDVYGIEIEFENNALSNCRLTAKFKERKPKDAIEIIARTFNLSFEFQNGKAVLKGRGC